MTFIKSRGAKPGKKSGKGGGQAAGQFSEQQLRSHMLKVLEEVCDQLAGPGVFRQFSAVCKLRMLGNRYPSVRLKAGDVCRIDAAQFKFLNETFKRMLSEELVGGVAGDGVPLATYLREGVMLLHYVEVMEALGSAKPQEMRAGFSRYAREQEGYIAPVRMVAQLMRKFCVVMSDWSTGILCYDLSGLCAIGGDVVGNEVLLSTPKPELRLMKLEGHSRELVRVGWSDFNGEVFWVKVKPQSVGFCGLAGPGVLVDIYIQRHALQRLQERVGLIPGLMREAIYESFAEGKLVWHKRSEKRLVEFKVLDKKLGYLVCSMDEGLIVIRSFLFLTHSGTPEGNKLSELTSLEPLDKRYLGIDTLLGFAGFNFGEDRRLSALFIGAGCGGLLEVAELLKFTKQEVKGQDAEVLMRYLVGRGLGSPGDDRTLFNSSFAEELRSEEDF